MYSKKEVLEVATESIMAVSAVDPVAASEKALEVFKEKFPEGKESWATAEAGDKVELAMKEYPDRPRTITIKEIKIDDKTVHMSVSETSISFTFAVDLNSKEAIWKYYNREFTLKLV